jgi:hypothetical protein
MTEPSREFRYTTGSLRELWASVLAQAVADIFIFRNKMTVVRADVVYAHRAWLWVHSPKRGSIYDCAEVCRFIGMSQDRVMRYVAQMREELFWHLENIREVKPYREKIRTRLEGKEKKEKKERAATINLRRLNGKKRGKYGRAVRGVGQSSHVGHNGLPAVSLTDNGLGGPGDKEGAHYDPILNPPPGALWEGIVLDGGVHPSQGALEGGL